MQQLTQKMDDAIESGTNSVAMRRRAAASLSPSKERQLLSACPIQIAQHPDRPLSTRCSLNTKFTNIARGIRPPTKPPPLPRHSIAVSQEETCLVSAAGDVLVCRSRDFSQLMDGQLGQGSSAAGLKSGGVGWCDMECSDLPSTLEKSALCNPWMTRLGSQREEKKEDDPTPAIQYPLGGGLNGGSTYEWEPQSADSKRRRGGAQVEAKKDHNFVPWSDFGVGGGLRGGSADDREPLSSDPVDQENRALGDLEYEVLNPSVPAADPIVVEDYDEDRVLSMPSFDYSHFGNGGNDMVPTSPIHGRSRGPLERAEIDTVLGPKHSKSAGKVHHIPQAFVGRSTSTGQSEPAPRPPLFHGVPTFLTSLLQVRIQQVSAHPRGSHVLMISAEALLFTYGLNDHGQLGIGIKSPPAGQSVVSGDRYVWTPTIITPLLENGGKAIACAAGESHSLVVVSTEGRRVLKSQSPTTASSIQNRKPQIRMDRVSSSPQTTKTNIEQGVDESDRSTSSGSTVVESVWHHQLYGFGRNNFMKIGLVHPKRKPLLEQPTTFGSSTVPKEPNFTTEGHRDDMEDVLLPHRVALHCTVWPEKASERQSHSGLPRQGIFGLAASSEHSAALVRRATGDIELYTWGNAAYHALGIPPKKLVKLEPSKICPVPTLIDRLSCFVRDNGMESKTSLLKSESSEFPACVALGPYSSFVVTSMGRCLSFGISYDGMLGHGKNVTEVKEPSAIAFPGSTQVTSVSAGTGHVMALGSCGTVFAWGKNTDGRLGLGSRCGTGRADASDLEGTIEWLPREVPTPRRQARQHGVPSHSSLGTRVSSSDATCYGPIVQICAGLDCSLFVTTCGQVLSCGKHSGRLGLGESDADAHLPTPLFGGLRLWYRPAARPPASRITSSSASPVQHRPVLKRGLTLPG